MKKKIIYLTLLFLMFLFAGVTRSAEIVANGSVDVSVYIVIEDSNGDPNASATITDFDLYYQEYQVAQSAKVDCTALAAADSAHADNKAFHVGNGLFRFDFPDAAFDGGVGKQVTLIVDDGATSNRTAFLTVLLTPPVDAVGISGDATTADNLQTITANMLTVFSTDFATNYDAVLDRWNVDAEAISGDTTTADNLQTITANMLMVYSTDFATNYDGANDMWNVDIEKWLGTACAAPTTAGVPEVDITYVGGNAVPCTTAQLVSDGASATDIVDEWETQSQADPTGFHVNVKEVNGTAQTANDNGADINAILTDTDAYDTDAEHAAAIFNAATASYGGAGTYGQAIEDVLADTGTDGVVIVDNGITAAKMATNSITSDEIDATAVTEIAAGVTAVSSFATTTISSATDGQTFVLTDALVVSDNTYKGFLLSVTDADGDNSPEMGVVKTYTSGTKTIVLYSSLSFTPANGDAVAIYPMKNILAETITTYQAVTNSIGWVLKQIIDNTSW